jgi:hypothetical protein
MVVVFVILVAFIGLFGGTLYLGFAPLHLASASELVAFRDRINAADHEPDCSGATVAPGPPAAEIDWFRRKIRLRRFADGTLSLPSSLEMGPGEKDMLPVGPYVATVPCAVN